MVMTAGISRRKAFGWKILWQVIFCRTAIASTIMKDILSAWFALLFKWLWCFYFIWLGIFYFFVCPKRGVRYHFLLRQEIRDVLGNQPVYAVLVGKTYFHLCRMDVDIHTFRRNRNMYYTEWISVLHQIRLITFLYRLWDDFAFDISVIEKIVFKIPVCAVQRRLSEKSFQYNVFINHLKFHHLICDVPAENAVNNCFQVPITVCVEFRLAIYDILKRNFRTWQCHVLQ